MQVTNTSARIISVQASGELVRFLPTLTLDVPAHAQPAVLDALRGPLAHYLVSGELVVAAPVALIEALAPTNAGAPSEVAATHTEVVSNKGKTRG